VSIATLSYARKKRASAEAEAIRMDIVHADVTPITSRVELRG
jgi:hypothetical protein